MCFEFRSLSGRILALIACKMVLTIVDLLVCFKSVSHCGRVIALVVCRDGRGSYFFHGAGRGGERQGKKSTGRGGAGNPPFPTMRGGAGKGSKSAGWGGAGAGNMLRVSAD